MTNRNNLISHSNHQMEYKYSMQDGIDNYTENLTSWYYSCSCGIFRWDVDQEAIGSYSLAQLVMVSPPSQVAQVWFPVWKLGVTAQWAELSECRLVHAWLEIGQAIFTGILNSYCIEDNKLPILACKLHSIPFQMLSYCSQISVFCI